MATDPLGTRVTGAQLPTLVPCRCAALVLVGLILTQGPLLARQGPGPTLENTFGVGVAISSHQWRDEVLNPARHDGWFPTLSLSYERPSEASRGRFDLQLAFSPIQSRYDPGKDSFASGLELAYRRTLRAGSLPGGFPLWLGAQVEASSDFAYFGNWDDSHFYWLTAYSLGFAGALDHVRSPGRRLSLSWQVPLVALVSRPSSPILYKVVKSDFGAIVSKLHEHPRLTSLHEHRVVDLALRYTRDGATIGHTFFWRFEYADTDLPDSERVVILRHSFGLTVAW
jgi:hypothetical protein